MPKTALRFLAALLMIGMLCHGDPVVAQAPEQVRVTASAANVRSGPGLHHPVLLIVPQRTVVAVLQREGEWFEVRVPPELSQEVTSGFIHRSIVEQIRVEPERPSPGDAESPPTVQERPGDLEREGVPERSPPPEAGQERSGPFDGGRWGVGVQTAVPSWGLSGVLDMSEQFSLQAIVGPFGRLNTFAARGRWGFNSEEFYSLYGYGMVGGWRYTDRFNRLSETSMGFGAGLGIEGDWRGIDPNLPPFFFSGELGLAIVDFDVVGFGFSTLTIGLGIHYRASRHR